MAKTINSKLTIDPKSLYIRSKIPLPDSRNQGIITSIGNGFITAGRIYDEDLSLVITRNYLLIVPNPFSEKVGLVPDTQFLLLMIDTLFIILYLLN